MKKYLMMGAAAMFVGAFFVACSNEKDLYDPNYDVQSFVTKYQEAFIKAYGQPAANQTWGFGAPTAASRMTRAAYPDGITFRDTKPNDDKPAVPTFYKTLEDVQAAGIPYAGDIDRNNGWDNVSAAYIDANNTSQNGIRSDRSNGKTFYVSGEVTYYSGLGNGDNNQPVTLVVLENSTLHLGCVGHNLNIYLAAGAKLDVTKQYSENVISWWPYEAEVTEKDWEGQFTLEKANAYLYLSAGSEVVGTDFKFFDGCKILNDGGTITAANIDVDKNTTLWNEGTVTVTNNLQGVNESALIYNAEGKTISAATVNLINNSDLLYNDGIVTTTGAITTHNSEAEVVNNGQMSCASYSQAAGGMMHNVGTVTMDGKTDLTNENSKWQNDGHWTCGSFDVDNYSDKNFNNCLLTVNGNFFLNRGTFVLNTDAGVVCNSFTWEDTSDFYLGGKSVLKVNGTLTTNNYNSGYGFRGVGSDYAVIEAEEIAKGKGDVQFSMSYFGNLYIATDKHFAQGALDPMNEVPAQPYYYYEPTVKFKFEGATTATIPSNQCNPGYEGGGEPTTKTIRIMAEDLSASEASDFDFNDVVFDVEADFSSSDAVSQVKITLWAAGGTLPLKINSVEGRNGFEVHEALGITDVLTMINTHAMSIARDPYKAADNVAKYTETITLANGATISKDNFEEDVNNYVRVEVQKEGEGGSLVWCLLTAERGKPACKIGVPVGTPWVLERHNIANAFTNFQEWVNNAEPANWYVSKVADQLYNDGKSVICAHGCTN